jgi:hypothetical protein
MHAGPVGFRTRREAQAEALHHRANKIQAGTSLCAGDYLAWDEFQRDLANFHRDHGRPAHRELRIMSPQTFIKRHRATGKIDIKLASESLEAAEASLQERRIERFRGV